jgi:hypothetical protein
MADFLGEPRHDRIKSRRSDEESQRCVNRGLSSEERKAQQFESSPTRDLRRGTESVSVVSG